MKIFMKTLLERTDLRPGYVVRYGQYVLCDRGGKIISDRKPCNATIFKTLGDAHLAIARYIERRAGEIKFDWLTIWRINKTPNLKITPIHRASFNIQDAFIVLDSRGMTYNFINNRFDALRLFGSEVESYTSDNVCVEGIRGMRNLLGSLSKTGEITLTIKNVKVIHRGPQFTLTKVENDANY